MTRAERRLPPGWTARYRHLRSPSGFTTTDLRKHGRSPLPRGGRTEARIFDDDGELRNVGIARCSQLDAYNRRLGREIALGRALKELGL